MIAAFRIPLLLGMMWPVAIGNMRSSKFQLKSNMLYRAFDAQSLLANISVNSVTKCASQCLNYPHCLTANFFSEDNLCSLWNECYLMGEEVSTNEVTIIIQDSLGQCQVNASKGLLLNLTNPTATNYTFHSYLYMANASLATLTFALINNQDAWLVDDVFVWNGSQNILINGGFENGTLHGWNYSYNGSCSNISCAEGMIKNTITSNPAHGPHSGSYYYEDGVWDTYSYLRQSFPTVPKQVYNISFWLSSTMPGSATLLVEATVSIAP